MQKFLIVIDLYCFDAKEYDDKLKKAEDHLKRTIGTIEKTKRVENGNAIFTVKSGHTKADIEHILKSKYADYTVKEQ